MNWRLVCGNAIAELPKLDPESVQCVVTSPPYWGLRKYEGDQDYIWGGDVGCEHEWIIGNVVLGNNRNFVDREGRGSNNPSIGGTTNACLKCGAWKGAYGLEPTPEMYVAHTVQFLNEIKRVLRPDGVCFWNLGDSYGSGFSVSDNKYKAMSGGEPSQRFYTGLKPKDLCLIPFRVAIAAQESGWWVRSVIIWSKPNPMPESVKDRPTDSHEYILMLTKSRKYYWDIDAVREPDSGKNRSRPFYTKQGASARALGGSSTGNEGSGVAWADTGTRNIRTVWQFPTQPYPGAHFAVFPQELPRRCILAATRESDTVLDPFAGAGTTLLVADSLNRKSIGIELSARYCALATKRLLGVK